MTDLKISQFTDGGLIETTDEIAGVRDGENVKVTFGTAAASDADDFATAAQGALADSAVQPTSSETLENKTLEDAEISVVTPDTNSAGYLGCPQNSQSADYTFVLADDGKHVYHPDADTTARTWTIPANGSVAFPIGTVIVIQNGNGAGVINLAITTDTLRWGSSTGSRSIAANGTASLLKVTSTVWRLTGDGIT